MKTTLITIGSLIIVTGIGLVIYSKMKAKAPAKDQGGTTDSGTSTAGTGNKNIDKVVKDINTGVDVFNALKEFTAEKFPLQLGMNGPKIKQMQDAIRNKFNQLTIPSSGIYEFKTLNALKAIGYATLLNNGITEAAFNNILNGVKK